MSEAPVLANTRKEASRIGIRLFRNNRGTFRTLDGKRVVDAGLDADGSSDLIGIVPVVITPDMVGMTLGVFTGAEVKEPDWKYSGTDHEETQLNFHEQIRKLGGFGFFINNHADLQEKIDNQLSLQKTKIGLDRGTTKEYV